MPRAVPFATVAATLALAACTTPPARVAGTSPPIAVSCTTDALSEQPCIAEARQQCASPKVESIRMVAATPVTTGVDQHAVSSYQYRVTYSCPP